MSNIEEEVKEEVVSEEEQSDSDLIKNNSLSILALNLDFENALLYMKQYAGGSSPEALFIMVEKLIKEYEFEVERLAEKKRYKYELEKKEAKVNRKLDKVKLSYRKKRKRFLIRRRRILQRKLFKLFKKKILMGEINSINKKKSELNEINEQTNISTKNLKLETKQTKDKIKALNAPPNKNKKAGS